jgi:hypothetical protein
MDTPDDPTSDPFGPPTIPTLVGCLHCQQEYESYLIERRCEPDGDGVPRWWWCCPMPGCGGRGFGFDILPVDHDWTDENGERMWVDDPDDEFDDDEDFDDDYDPPPPPDPNRPPKKDDDIDISW